jgi:hypothetical protein
VVSLVFWPVRALSLCQVVTATSPCNNAGPKASASRKYLHRGIVSPATASGTLLS